MEENLDDRVAAPVAASDKSGGLNPKVFIIGLPLFIVQLVLVYFITANILQSKGDTQIKKTGDAKAEVKPEKVAEGGGHLYPVSDVIVNPAGTGGGRLMLVSLGIDYSNAKDSASFKEKDVLLKDNIISTISSKNITQLSNASYKDTLKFELVKNLRKLFPTMGIDKIYFSKYIIQ